MLSDVTCRALFRRSFSKLDPEDQGFVTLEKLSALIAEMGEVLPQTDEVTAACLALLVLPWHRVDIDILLLILILFAPRNTRSSSGERVHP